MYPLFATFATRLGIGRVTTRWGPPLSLELGSLWKQAGMNQAVICQWKEIAIGGLSYIRVKPRGTWSA